jgi:predicted nucleotidyltransferase
MRNHLLLRLRFVSDIAAGRDCTDCSYMKRQPPFVEGRIMNAKIINRGREAETLSRDEVSHRLQKLVGEAGIKEFILFGSFARDTQTRDSDVDLIVVVDTEKPFFDRYDDILLLLHEKLRPHAVSPLIYTPDELERMRKRPFGIVPTACEEGIVIDVNGKTSV